MTIPETEHPVETFLKLKELIDEKNYDLRDEEFRFHLCEGISDVWDSLTKPAWLIGIAKNTKNENQPFSVVVDDHEVIDGKTVDTQFLIDNGKPSRFGHGSESKFDVNVRNCLEIAGKRVQTNVPTDAIARKILKQLFRGEGEVSLVLHKLLVYQKDGHFAEHVDSKHRNNHYGSVVVFLPSSFSGGQFSLTHAGKSVTLGYSSLFPEKKGSNQRMYNEMVDCWKFIAFFSECKHEVKPVVEGCRVALHYDIVWKQKKNAPDHECKISRNEKKLAKIMDKACDPPQNYYDEFETDDETTDPDSKVTTLRFRYKIVENNEIDKSTKSYKMKLKMMVTRLSNFIDSSGGTVGLLCKYQYRNGMLEPGKLKGEDELLYRDMIKKYKIHLVPVVLIFNGPHSDDPRDLRDDAFSARILDMPNIMTADAEKWARTRPLDVPLHLIVSSSAMENAKLLEHIGEVYRGNDHESPSDKLFHSFMAFLPKA